MANVNIGFGIKHSQVLQSEVQQKVVLAMLQINNFETLRCSNDGIGYGAMARRFTSNLTVHSSYLLHTASNEPYFDDFIVCYFLVLSRGHALRKHT